MSDLIIHCSKGRIKVIGYSVEVLGHTKEDFIFVNEFQDIMNSTKSFSLNFWEKQKTGVLTPDKLVTIINDMNQPDIYICGPERLEVAVTKMLESINYPTNKIFFERFTV